MMIEHAIMTTKSKRKLDNIVTEQTRNRGMKDGESTPGYRLLALMDPCYGHARIFFYNEHQIARKMSGIQERLCFSAALRMGSWRPQDG